MLWAVKDLGVTGESEGSARASVRRSPRSRELVIRSIPDSVICFSIGFDITNRPTPVKANYCISKSKKKDKVLSFEGFVNC